MTSKACSISFKSDQKIDFDRNYQSDSLEMYEKIEKIQNQLNNDNKNLKIQPTNRIQRRSILQRPNKGFFKLNSLFESNLDNLNELKSPEIPENVSEKCQSFDSNSKNSSSISNRVKSYQQNSIHRLKTRTSANRSNSDINNMANDSSTSVNRDFSNFTSNEEKLEGPRLLKKPDKTKLEYFSIKSKPMIIDFSEEFLQSLTNANSVLSPTENNIPNENFNTENDLSNSDKIDDLSFNSQNFGKLMNKILLKSSTVQNGNRSKSLNIPKNAEKAKNTSVKQLTVSLTRLTKIKAECNERENLNSKSKHANVDDKLFSVQSIENHDISKKASFNNGKKSDININDGIIVIKSNHNITLHRTESIKSKSITKYPENPENISTEIEQNQIEKFIPSETEISISNKIEQKIISAKHYEMIINDVIYDIENIIRYPITNQAFLVKFPIEELNLSTNYQIELGYSLIIIKAFKFDEDHKPNNNSLSFEQEYDKEIEKHRKPPIVSSKQPEKERKRIYTTVLDDIFQYFLEQYSLLILQIKSSNQNLSIKSKSNLKISSTNKKQKKLAEILINQETVVEIIDCIINDLFTNIEYKDFQLKPKCLSSKWMDDIVNLKFTNSSSNLENNEQTKSFLTNSFNNKENKNFIQLNPNISHQRLSSNEYSKTVVIEKLNPDLLKYETNMLNSFKQSILKYEMKFRKLTEEKDCISKENVEMMEQNKSLQKRHGLLLSEFKQEKREIVFIKNQIDIMISRLQSIPEKLIQLEAENENLKSEVSDLERTLVQRDQLFNSERQINASLSEEIIKLEADTVDKELMKNVCEEFENLNDEYETLKITLEETEDKLFEIVQDRENLIKHAKIMEEHLYKLRNENNYYQVMVSSGILPDGMNQRFPDNRDNLEFIPKTQTIPQAAEKHECETRSKQCHEQHSCRHLRSRGHSHRSNRSYTSSSSSISSSSSGSEKRHRKRKKKSHKHRHRESHSHKHSSHKRKDKKHSKHNNIDADVKGDLVNMNQNANIPATSVPVIEMPKSREELKELEKLYDSLQIKKSKLEGDLSHVPVNKGTSNTSNMTNMREQELLEDDLDLCDKKLAKLRKILRQCKVFKMVP